MVDRTFSADAVGAAPGHVVIADIVGVEVEVVSRVLVSGNI